MKKINLIWFFCSIGFFALGWILSNQSPASVEKMTEKVEEVWTCSMHPHIEMHEAGSCPICGMDLIIRKNESIGPKNDPQIVLSSYAQKLAQVQTTKVQEMTRTRSKELFGKLVWNETLLSTEAAWFDGRIEKLYMNHTGQYVKKGQVIAELYSPELYATAEEWKQAKNSGNKALEKAVTKKLELLGFSKKEIQALGKINSARVKLRTKHSGILVHRKIEVGQYVKRGTPLLKIGSNKKLWAELDVFEEDIGLLKKKQKVMIQVLGKEYSGNVELIHPAVNPMTRTVQVHVALVNPKNALRPGMLVKAMVQSSKKNGLFIPESAPLLTGNRAVVYIEKKGGLYSGREIVLGELFNGFYQVLEGLNVDERIVSRGAFKIDASMQMQGLPSMMSVEKQMEMTMEPNVDSMEGISLSEKKWLSAVYDSYLLLQKSLGKDELITAQKRRDSLLMVWKQKPKSLLVGSKIFEGSKPSLSLKEIKLEYAALSSLLADWLETASLTKKATVYFCPMANDEQGAKWLQDKGDIKNPYFGGAMSGCGAKHEMKSQEKFHAI